MMDKSKALKNRFAAPSGCSPLSSGVALSLVAVSSILAGTFPTDYGGIIFLIMSVGLFAYVVTARFRVWYICVAGLVSVLISTVCGIELPLSLVSLSYIPLAFVLSDSVRKRKSLSATVSALTGVLVVLIAVVLGFCYIFVKNDLIEAFTNIMNRTFDTLDIYIQRINQAAEAAGKAVYTENYVESLKNAVYLLMPSMIVLVCMAASYASAKVFRLATIVADSNEMFFGGIWPISASFIGSVVFLLCYVVSMFAMNSQVVYYSAVNVMYIFMPAQAIVGLRLMFGRGGFFRQGKLKGLQLITIGLFIYFALMNPIFILELAAMFTAFYNIRVWMFIRRKNKENKQD